MKRLSVFLLPIFICSGLCAQRPTFVRVYDRNYKKFQKGKVLEAADAYLRLNVNDKAVNVSISNIGKIKTKRSVGNNLLLGPLIGASAGFITFTFLSMRQAAGAEPISFRSYSTQSYSTSQLIGFGVYSGLSVGTTISVLTIPYKHSRTFMINGDSLGWKVFQFFILESERRNN